MTKILFITADEQRFDALSCTGNNNTKTPNLDQIASEGINYQRAYVNNVTCMPSRATMVTGQYPATHGVFSNGVPLPINAPSFSSHLQNNGFKTALIGKSHLEPVMGSSEDFWEVRAGGENNFGPYRGFDHVMISSHGKGVARNHYQVWMEENSPEEFEYYLNQQGSDGKLNTKGGGQTEAIQVHENKISYDNYHTNWLADRTIDWLSDQDQDDDWFLWLSFGDPHHPYQPPSSQLNRVNWKNIDLPKAYIESEEEIIKILGNRPSHWLDFYKGISYPCGEAPNSFISSEMSSDQVCEINSMVYIMNEIIDDAVGRVKDYLVKRGWDEDTHIIYTSDHGSLQGDYGLMFKGPFHVDSLMRVPLIWRPTKTIENKNININVPVSLVDLAPTFCKCASIEIPSWMQGTPLPNNISDYRDFVIVEWEQEHLGNTIQIQTIVTKNYICSQYKKTNRYPNGEGELYNYNNDPYQFNNLWNNNEFQTIKSELLLKLTENLPMRREKKLKRIAGA